MVNFLKLSTFYLYERIPLKFVSGMSTINIDFKECRAMLFTVIATSDVTLSSW